MFKLFSSLGSCALASCQTVHVAHAHRMRGTRWADDPAAIEAMQRRVPARVGAAFALIEDGMPEGPWVMGERYTIWDPYLFTLAEWLDGDGIDPAKLPRVIEHRTRMWDRAVKQAIAQDAINRPLASEPRRQ